MIDGVVYSFFDRDKKRCQEKAAPLATKQKVRNNDPGLTLGDFVYSWLDRQEELVRSGDRKGGAFLERKRQLEKYVIPEIGHVRLQSVTSEMIRDHFNELARTKIANAKPGAQKGTRSLQLAYENLRAVLSYAVVEGKLDANPLILPIGYRDGPKPKHDERPKEVLLTLEDCNALLTACRAKKEWLYMLAYTALHSGMRSGELRSLQVGDISFERQCIFVSRGIDKDIDSRAMKQGTTKTEAGSRRVDLSLDVLDKLRAWVAGKAKDALVFPNRSGKIMADNNLMKRYYHPAMRAAGLKADFHSLRHTHISILASEGKSEAYIEQRVGHSKLIKTYVHRFGSAKGDNTLQGMFV